MDNTVLIPEKKRSSKKRLIYVLLMVSILFFGTTGYFFYQYQTLSHNPMAAQIIAQKEAQRLAKDVGKLMIVPKDEIPTVATVTDIEKLKDQVFFKNATNGDKVLIYANSKQAIIYNPKDNIIVNVGPINFSQQPQAQVQQTVKPNPTASVKVSPTKKIE